MPDCHVYSIMVSVNTRLTEATAGARHTAGSQLTGLIQNTVHYTVYVCFFSTVATPLPVTRPAPQRVCRYHHSGQPEHIFQVGLRYRDFARAAPVSFYSRGATMQPLRIFQVGIRYDDFLTGVPVLSFIYMLLSSWVQENAYFSCRLSVKGFRPWRPCTVLFGLVAMAIIYK